MAERGHRRRAVTAGAVVVIAAGGGIAWASTRTSGPAYRLATVERSNVAQTVTSVGSMSSVSQRTLSFGVDGSVKSVDVGVGSEVTAGQVVARLDTTTLQQQLRSDESAVAAARQRLAADESAQSGSSATSTDSFVETRLGATPTRGGGGAVTTATIKADQQAVLAAQAKVDALLDGPTSPNNPRVLSADIAGLRTACATSAVTYTATSAADGTLSGTVSGGAGLPISLVGGTYADGSPVPSGVVAADGTYAFGSSSQPLRASASYTMQIGDSSHGVVGSGRCAAALTTVEDDEQAVSQAERQLAGAERKLDADLAAYSASANGKGQSSTPSNSSSTPASNPSSSKNDTNSSTTITAEQLAADQKQVDAARAQLGVSRQNLAAATLRAPIDGTVGAVTMTPGSPASSATLTIIGHGRKSVTVSVGIGVIDRVHVGQTAQVTIDGVTTRLRGKVTEVGVLNASGTSGSSASYPVTVLLDATSLAIYDGAGATVAIDVGTAHNVLAVPTSAVHRTAFGASVDRLVNGKVVPTRVTLGSAGLDLVEIKTGLVVGQRVVLAKVSAAVPSDNSFNGRGGFGKQATFGGGVRRVVSGP